MDVASEDSVAAGVACAVEAMNGLDTLVNVAGILRSAHFTETTLADFEQVLRINLIGTFLVTRQAIPALRLGKAPAVVNFSSTSANFAHPYMSAYAASKAGVQAMTHALALEFSKEGIRFNCVQPGSISSGMTEGTGESKQSVGPGLPADADQLSQRLQSAVAEQPIGEAGTLQLSAGAAELVSDEDATGFFERADNALYRAKQSGKAEVAAADQPEQGRSGQVRGPGP